MVMAMIGVGERDPFNFKIVFVCLCLCALMACIGLFLMYFWRKDFVRFQYFKSQNENGGILSILIHRMLQ